MEDVVSRLQEAITSKLEPLRGGDPSKQLVFLELLEHTSIILRRVSDTPHDGFDNFVESTRFRRFNAEFEVIEKVSSLKLGRCIQEVRGTNKIYLFSNTIETEQLVIIVDENDGTADLHYERRAGNLEATWSIEIMRYSDDFPVDIRLISQGTHTSIESIRNALSIETIPNLGSAPEVIINIFETLGTVDNLEVRREIILPSGSLFFIRDQAGEDVPPKYRALFYQPRSLHSPGLFILEDRSNPSAVQVGAMQARTVLSNGRMKYRGRIDRTVEEDQVNTLIQQLLAEFEDRLVSLADTGAEAELLLDQLDGLFSTEVARVTELRIRSGIVPSSTAHVLHSEGTMESIPVVVNTPGSLQHLRLANSLGNIGLSIERVSPNQVLHVDIFRPRDPTAQRALSLSQIPPRMNLRVPDEFRPKETSLIEAVDRNTGRPLAIQVPRESDAERIARHTRILRWLERVADSVEAVLIFSTDGTLKTSSAITSATRGNGIIGINGLYQHLVSEGHTGNFLMLVVTNAKIQIPDSEHEIEGSGLYFFGHGLNDIEGQSALHPILMAQASEFSESGFVDRLMKLTRHLRAVDIQHLSLF
jgi:hypothetical protein